MLLPFMGLPLQKSKYSPPGHCNSPSKPSSSNISTTCKSGTSPSLNSTNNPSFLFKIITVSNGKYVISTKRNGSSALQPKAPPFL